MNIKICFNVRECNESVIILVYYLSLGHLFPLYSYSNQPYEDMLGEDTDTCTSTHDHG